MSGDFAKKASKGWQFFQRAWFLPVAVIALFLLVWALIYAPWDSPAAPAWVQAIGSVAAILSAVGISYWQYHQTSRTNEDAAREYMRRAHLDSAYANGFIEALSMVMVDGKIPRNRLDRMIRLVKAVYEDMRVYSHIQMPDQRFAANWQTYLRSLRHFIEEIERDYADETGRTQVDAARHLEIFQSSSQMLNEAYDRFMVGTARDN
ncbi:hypothetical protein [Pseudomonas sp. PA27(2017)]|uniref:hypothetical protein n=1 Tax=Pseudomonas sp. PA27(2017) TaxID=1932112 RepID=UPI00095A8131|nr:hypothetical protein [Pseudomonas sp. PA27(2017)]OLU23843.1 hypothetical protein BVH06_21945 [Pseudomonas sp. PA27(2017)]